MPRQVRTKGAIRLTTTLGDGLYIGEMADEKIPAGKGVVYYDKSFWLGEFRGGTEWIGVHYDFLGSIQHTMQDGVVTDPVDDAVVGEYPTPGQWGTDFCGSLFGSCDMRDPEGDGGLFVGEIDEHSGQPHGIGMLYYDDNEGWFFGEVRLQC